MDPTAPTVEADVCLHDLLMANPNWEFLTPQHEKFSKFSSQLPVLVVEWPKAGVTAPSKVPGEFKVCQQCWNGLSGVTFLPIVQASGAVIKFTGTMGEALERKNLGTRKNGSSEAQEKVL